MGCCNDSSNGNIESIMMWYIESPSYIIEQKEGEDFWEGF